MNYYVISILLVVLGNIVFRNFESMLMRIKESNFFPVTSLTLM